MNMDMVIWFSGIPSPLFRMWLEQPILLELWIWYQLGCISRVHDLWLLKSWGIPKFGLFQVTESWSSMTTGQKMVPNSSLAISGSVLWRSLETGWIPTQRLLRFRSSHLASKQTFFLDMENQGRYGKPLVSDNDLIVDNRWRSDVADLCWFGDLPRLRLLLLSEKNMRHLSIFKPLFSCEKNEHDFREDFQKLQPI